MDIEKIFNDLESSKTQECDEAKKKLFELFFQSKHSKEHWAVNCCMEYYLKTGSLRIMEVLVRVQSPHDNCILDRLAEWLRVQANRVHALNLFFFVVRCHPTWLYKLEKHRLTKDILKLLLHEKEIVPLMSALLCIITLLPIIPNSVPSLLGELCEVFSHLAAANCHNHYRLSEDKIVHLQLGLQMLFHRLYGMYPCNFLNYLSDLAKRDRDFHTVFQHTIKPLLETVRVHPMLVTATTESEMNATRWKEMEPHDVVMECVQVSLPVMHQHCNAEHAHHLSWHSSDSWHTSSVGGRNTHAISGMRFDGQHFLPPQRVLLQPQRYGGPIKLFDVGAAVCSTTAIWSPNNEICASGPIPLTPTPAYPLVGPTSAVGDTINLNNQLLGVTGSSPPEAAVEATPETTPMKDVKEQKERSATLSAPAPTLANPHAVRAIFLTSQPSSPLRKEQHNQQFNFPDMSSTEVSAASRVTGTLDRKLQQVIQDRSNSQSPFQTIEAQAAKYVQRSSSKLESLTPDIGSDTSSHATPLLGPCEGYSDGGRCVCKAGGGVHLCIGPCMNVLAKDIRRRTRMATYNCNEYSYERLGIGKWDVADSDSGSLTDGALRVRRTKSCSSFAPFRARTDEDFTDLTVAVIQQHTERRLQKSGKMLAIATATKKLMPAAVSVASQTVKILPNTYEDSLLRILENSEKLQQKYDTGVKHPHEMLDQYILQSIRMTKESASGGYRDQEQYQLLWLHLQYERYRRDIHAERNRRLMGRSRYKRNLEMERDSLRKQLCNFAAKNKELVQQIDKTVSTANECEQVYTTELTALKAKYQNELEQNKCLRQANENLQTSLHEEQTKHQLTQSEMETQRGKIFNLTAELEHAQQEASMGLHWKQELARLEAEFIVMGEVQIKCRDRLAELENYRARDEELRMLQESYNVEMKDLKHTLDEKSSHLDSAKYKIAELQAQLQNNEKVITEQKRLLKAVKDEYEERFKSLSKKYDVQKTILTQMEEKIIMSLHKPQSAAALNACSPDTDRTDIASSIDRNSPLSTSLASSESYSTSLRSTELRNLQQLLETSVPEVNSISVVGGASSGKIIEGTRLPTLDLASSANTATSAEAGMAANAINIVPIATTSTAAAMATAHNYDMSAMAAATTSQHNHPHLHLQQLRQHQQRH